MRKHYCRTKSNWKLVCEQQNPCQQLQIWQPEGNKVEISYQDNAGENNLFEEVEASTDWKLSTKFKYTARVTPLINSPVEFSFPTQARLTKSMFDDANFNSAMSFKLAIECLSLANKNCNLAVSQFNKQQMTGFEASDREIPKQTKN